MEGRPGSVGDGQQKGRVRREQLCPCLVLVSWWMVQEGRGCWVCPVAMETTVKQGG
jgi:hypothetical protein